MGNPVRTAGRMLLPLLAVFLMGMDGPAPDDAERRMLERREEQLAARIRILRQEQELLLFRGAFSVSDSKYLLLDLHAARGTLSYRNRVLRSFSLKTSPSKAGRILAGPHSLAGKREDKRGRKSLVFNGAFIIQSKQPPRINGGEGKLPRITIGKRDLAAIYYALEQGSMVYIMH